MTVKVVFLKFLSIEHFRISYVTPLKSTSQREAQPIRRLNTPALPGVHVHVTSTYIA
jgi:hypothetical protein